MTQSTKKPAAGSQGPFETVPFDAHSGCGSIPGGYGLSALFALGDADQAVAGHAGAFRRLQDIAEADQLRHVMRRHRGIVGGDRDFDQRGKFLGRQKLGGMYSHHQLAINVRPRGRPEKQRRDGVTLHYSIYFRKLLAFPG